MLDFSKNRKSNLIIVTLIITMIILLTNATLVLATTEGGKDTTAPKVEIGLRPGRVQVGTKLTFIITDDSPITKIHYMWDQHVGNKVLKTLKMDNLVLPDGVTLTGTDTRKELTIEIPYSRRSIRST